MLVAHGHLLQEFTRAVASIGKPTVSVVTGFALGVIEGLTKYFYPEASNTVVFVLMVLVLLIKPTGLTGRAA